jgi:UDP-N-acetylglucosamine acyltransferase
MQPQTIIHPTALVEPGARLGAGVSIGPFCHVGGDAVLGDRVELVSHVSIQGATTLGEGCVVHPMAILGGPPQNAKHRGGRTTLVVGANCIIREAVTMHRGTDTSRGETIVGENGNFLAYAHIAHDCIVGRNVTMANVATLGGHCEIGDFVNIGGLSAVHQMTRIGHHAFVGGASIVVADLIPYGMAVGNRASLRGLNIVGMKRSGIPRDEIFALRRAYRMLFDRSHTLSENLDRVDAAFPEASVRDVAGFLRGGGKRRFTIPRLKTAVFDDSDDEG